MGKSGNTMPKPNRSMKMVRKMTSNAVLRGAGFSVEMTAHAFALIDSYVYGFALSEAALPINGPETVTEVAESMMQLFSADEYPHLAV